MFLSEPKSLPPYLDPVVLGGRPEFYYCPPNASFNSLEVLFFYAPYGGCYYGL